MFDQWVKVGTAREKETTPLVDRAVFMWRNQPVRTERMTRLPDGSYRDLRFTPSEAVRFDRIVFKGSGGVFVYRCGKQMIRGGQQARIPMGMCQWLTK